MIRFFIAVIVAATLQACAVQTVRHAPLNAFVVGEEERRLGAYARQRIAEESELFRDDGLQRYLETVARNVLAAVPHGNERLTFSLIDDDRFAAHVLPDGHILITRGMLGLLNSEAQLAAVLAHELGHLINHHTLEKLRKTRRTEELARKISEKLDSSYAKRLSSTFAHAISRGYSREAETEADRVALQILQRAGYPPVAMLEILELFRRASILEQEVEEKGDVSKGYARGAFSTHPAVEQRLQTVANVLRESPDLRKPSAGFDEDYLRRIDGMKIAHFAGGPFRQGNRLYHPAWQASFLLEEGERFYRVGDDLLFIYLPTHPDWILRIQMFTPPEAPGVDEYMDKRYPNHRRAAMREHDKGVIMIDIESGDTSPAKKTVAWRVLRTASHSLVMEGGDPERMGRFAASYTGSDLPDPETERAHFIRVVPAELARNIAAAVEGEAQLNASEWLLNLEYDVSKLGDSPVKLLE